MSKGDTQCSIKKAKKTTKTAKQTGTVRNKTLDEINNSFQRYKKLSLIQNPKDTRDNGTQINGQQT